MLLIAPGQPGPASAWAGALPLRAMLGRLRPRVDALESSGEGVSTPANAVATTRKDSYILGVSRMNWPHSPSEAPLSVWGYVAICICGALAQMVVVGGAITWALALPGAIGFGFVLLHGLRVFRQIALVICVGALFFAPATHGPLWLAIFPLFGLVLLLLPSSREFCSTNSATELAGA
jgi:hypothetical protein